MNRSLRPIHVRVQLTLEVTLETLRKIVSAEIVKKDLEPCGKSALRVQRLTMDIVV